MAGSSDEKALSARNESRQIVTILPGKKAQSADTHKAKVCSATVSKYEILFTQQSFTIVFLSPWQQSFAIGMTGSRDAKALKNYWHNIDLHGMA